MVESYVMHAASGNMLSQPGVGAPMPLVDRLVATSLHVPCHASCGLPVCYHCQRAHSLCMCVKGLTGFFFSGQHPTRPTQRQSIIKLW